MAGFMLFVILEQLMCVTMCQHTDQASSCWPNLLLTWGGGTGRTQSGHYQLTGSGTERSYPIIRSVSASAVQQRQALAGPNTCVYTASLALRSHPAPCTGHTATSGVIHFIKCFSTAKQRLSCSHFEKSSRVIPQLFRFNLLVVFLPYSTIQ